VYERIEAENWTWSCDEWQVWNSWPQLAFEFSLASTVYKLLSFKLLVPELIRILALILVQEANCS
jgi:hypothetical protein